MIHDKCTVGHIALFKINKYSWTDPSAFANNNIFNNPTIVRLNPHSIGSRINKYNREMIWMFVLAVGFGLPSGGVDER